eukprot:5756557-Heterocapsa_arctica.AAC.1
MRDNDVKESLDKKAIEKQRDDIENVRHVKNMLTPLLKCKIAKHGKTHHLKHERLKQSKVRKSISYHVLLTNSPPLELCASNDRTFGQECKR